MNRSMLSVLGALALIVPGPARGSDDLRPNVVLIVLDTVRDDRVGAAWHGVPLTPAVDSVAAMGTRFTTALAPAPWTVPSHATMFTGLSPHRHHADHERFVLSDSLQTLAEALRSRGYVTAGISCNPWVGQKLGFAQGFDRFTEAYRGKDAERDVEAAATTEAAQWIDQAARGDAPFFLFLNVIKAHLPYTPPADVLARLPAESGAATRDALSVPEAERHLARLSLLGARDLAAARRLYAAEIAAQDREVGRVLRALRRPGLLERTLLLIVSDHGEQLGEHGLLGHEFTLYEDALRVPLIAVHPGTFPAGKRVDAPVGLIDLFPTVLQLADRRDPPDGLPGRSLVETLRRPDPDRALIADYPRPSYLITRYWRENYPGADMTRFDTSLTSVRVGSYKYIVNGGGRESLYDLNDDPGEERDLSARHPDLVARLRARLGALEAGP